MAIIGTIRSVSWRAAAAGPTKTATTSRLPRPCTATTIAAASRTSSAASATRRREPQRPRRAAVEAGRQQPPVQQPAAPPRRPTTSAAAATRSASVGPRMSPNSSVSIPGGESGESASSTPSPNIVVTTTATPTSRPTPGTREASAIASAASDDRRRRPEQQRHPGDRGEHQAREDRVGERLGRVGELVEDDPAAERAAGQAEQGHLGDRPLHERFLEGLEHQWWWWCGGRIASAGAGDLDDRAAVGGFEHLAVERLRGRPDGDLAAVDAEDRVPAPRLLEVVGGDRRSPCPSPASAAISASSRSAAGRSRPVKGSSISSTRASWTRARAIRTRWRWPPESSPKVSPGELLEPDPLQRRAAPPRAPRGPGRRHQGRRESAPIVATSRAETG